MQVVCVVFKLFGIYKICAHFHTIASFNKSDDKQNGKWKIYFIERV